jgi:neutral ceramidase
VLEAGYAKIDILPPGELHLIGTYARRPRIPERIRDRPLARALALRSGDRQVVIIGADLLCISEELHLAVVERLGNLGLDSLFLAATHTHTSYGGFFHSSAAEKMLGAPRPEIFDFLTGKLVELAETARADLRPARAVCSTGEVSGLVSSRRQAGGSFDDLMVLLRLERSDRESIDLVAASGHPVIGSEREPRAVSGDYPGEFCRRLEQAGSLPVFLSAGLGGASILFPEFRMDLERHLDLVTGLLLKGHRRAADNLRVIQDQDLQIDFFRLPHKKHQSRIFAGLGPGGKILDAALWPLRRWLARSLRSALPLENGVPVHLVRLGDFLLAGSAAELGVSVVQGIRAAADRRGMPTAMVASLVDGYAGYTHLSPVYRLRPEKGYRFMALYENSLAAFGYELGDRILEAVDQKLG